MDPVDPVVSGILRAALAWVFAQAALHKLRDASGFTAIVRGYRLVPEAAAPIVTAALVPCECVAVAALVLPGLAPAGAAMVALLLVVYSIAIGINLARGRRDVDCGCLGPGHRQTLSGWLLVRNAALLGISVAVALPVSTRPLGWLDAVTGMGGALVVVLIFSAGTRLTLTAGSRVSTAVAPVRAGTVR